MVKSWSSLLGLVLTVTTLTTLLSLVPYTSAQAPSPNLTSVQEMAFARAGSRLYINGGRVSKNGNNTLISGQFFSLDLSQSWDVNSAPWQVLPSTGAKYAISMVASPDNKTLYTLEVIGTDNSVLLTNYNIGMNVWDSRVVTIPQSSLGEFRQGISPIIDPNTWTIYMNGYVNGLTNLDVYNLNTSGLSTQILPQYILTSPFYGRGVYNKLRNSLMYFGGWNATKHFDPLATYVSEYNLTAKTWANVSTTGTAPPVRSDFCMAVNDDGSKVVVYGGRVAISTEEIYTGTFFILDVRTGKWTEGPPGDVCSYMACIIVGDQFLAWGGSFGITTWDTPPRIFDMTLGNWTTTYKAPAYYSNTPKFSSAVPSPSSTTLPSAGGNGSPSTSPNNLGAILGGTFGGMLILVSVGLIFVYLKRRENRIKNGITSEQQQQQTDRSRDFNNGNTTNGNVKEREEEDVSAVMLLTSESELRSPQKGIVGAQESELRNPQEGMLGAQDSEPRNPHSPMMSMPELRNPHSPIISTTGGHTPYSHLYSPVFSNFRQSTAFGSSTELSQQQSDVYDAQYHPGAGTATPDGSSTVAGSPLNSDSLVYTSAPKSPNTVPSDAYNNNAYSAPVMHDPTSIATSFSSARAPVTMSAFVPPPPTSNLMNISDVIYASSPTTSHVSPALPSSAGQQTPVTALSNLLNPVSSTIVVGVPETVTEDLHPVCFDRSTTVSNLAAVAPGSGNVLDSTQYELEAISYLPSSSEMNDSGTTVQANDYYEQQEQQPQQQDALMETLSERLVETLALPTFEDTANPTTTPDSKSDHNPELISSAVSAIMPKHSRSVSEMVDPMVNNFNDAHIP
ncbi:hypothetical protein BGZ83_000987, partial [Gryganskiella cystojenkinii]